MKKEDLDYLDFKNKYGEKIEEQLGERTSEDRQVTTSDYESFKASFLPAQLNFYERACNFAENVVPISPDKEKIPEVEEAIRISHLNVTPKGTTSFAALMSLCIVIVGIILGYVVPFVVTGGEFNSFFFIFFSLFLGLAAFIPLTKIPFIASNIWRMKASNQMVLAVFYIVTYMRHTPNLELAIDFASEHLAPPLSLDLKKVVWDIETGRFDNINESLDSYLQTWREYNPEFIESMHLIQGSLYENDETRRQDQLDKSLDVILDQTYEKMLHYTHDLKTPITTLHMLGIVLPILGLVILPLLTAFVEAAEWYHIASVYNIFLPLAVYYIGRDVLSTRPSGYGGADMSQFDESTDEDDNVTYSYSDEGGIEVTPAMAGFSLFVVLFLLGVSPVLMHQINPDFDVHITNQGLAFSGGLEPGEQVYLSLLDYRMQELEDGSTREIGPFGVGASILGLFIPLSIALGLSTYYRLKVGDRVKVREETEDLEQEFASALFQLGNRLGDGVPAEVAFSNVSKTMEDSKSAKFFDIVTVNIGRLGMSVKNAIFDKEVGALKFFPSHIIESSMKVFVESIKKGPKVASQSLITVAEYIKSMHRVDERLKDLLADIVSSMRSQISFLTPIIAGIVVGITSMISQILGALSNQMETVTGEVDAQQVAGGAQGILDSFGAGAIPTYHFQAIVGVYVVQITFILTIMINGIENGIDDVNRKDMLQKNLFRTSLLYAGITAFFTIAFSVVANGIISGIAS